MSIWSPSVSRTRHSSSRTSSPSHLAKGQGATEYLLILAVVLVVVMVAIALLASAPGSASDLRSSTSATYWTSQASPFLITNQNLSADGILTLTLANSGPTALQITRMNLSGTGMYTSSFSAPLSVGSGKRALETVFMNGSCAPTQVYELVVNMTMSDLDSELPSRIQSGSEPLVGHCNEASFLPSAPSQPPPPPPPGGLLPNGSPCSTPNDCQSHHCHDTGGGKICVECIGNGHCSPPLSRCFNYVCQSE